METVKVRLLEGRRDKPGGGVYKAGDVFDMKANEAGYVVDNYPKKYELVTQPKKEVKP